MFTEKDKKLLEKKNISLEKANWQIEQFVKGVKSIKLIRPAMAGKGIIQLNDFDVYLKAYEENKGKITKFVPASGAASRMFKSLYEFREQLEIHSILDLGKYPEVKVFFENIQKFAFYEELYSLLKKDGGVKKLIETKNYKKILDKLLTSEGMAYGELPKGLLKFHKYSDGMERTPFEEHLVEGALYAKSYDLSVYLHFTISPENEDSFQRLKNKAVKNLSDKYNVNYTIDFSIQKPSTDTMAVTANNTPFYDSDGNILFRPGGHGALIENLNEIDSDIIFIKNIDNVVPETKLNTTILYKKALAGVLCKIQSDVFSLVEELTKNPDSTLVEKARLFCKEWFHIEGICTQKSKNKSQVEELIDQLNRPIRVCGMVKNSGEPGGGPFMIEYENGCIYPQIIESSQINNHDKEQVMIFESSTHFNPVDLVCGVKNFKGEKFNLSEFIDPSTCFISKKSKNGKELKALELPGLWNGAMAGWNTIFIEVPSETFNPVKTVNDLLRDSHQ